MPKTINLDHASSTILNKYAKKAILEFIEEPQLNIDSSYEPAVKKRRGLAETKNQIAKLLGAKSPNILITNGSSDANSKLLSLIFRVNSDLEITASEIEHSTLLDSISKFKNHKIIKIDSSTNQLDLKSLQESISNLTILVTVQYVNNETGQILPIKEISRIVRKVREERLRSGVKLPLFFHTDASQAATTQDLQVKRLGIDALSLNGSKFGALPSSGILYLSSEILRWLDENRVKLDQKKENPLSIISIYPSLKDSIKKKSAESKRLLSLAQAFHKEFSKLLPDAKLNPLDLKIGKNHAPHILNYQIPNVSGEKFVILAGMNRILISTGAACSASKNLPSHVLKALGLNLNQINSSIRVSFGDSNKGEKEVVEAARTLAQLAKNESVKLNSN
jgi:cysteine desulfurase